MELEDESIDSISQVTDTISSETHALALKTLKRYPVEKSAYKTSFIKCLTEVYDNELYLFDVREVACLSHYLYTLSDNGRYLFARLFLRSQRKWFRESDYSQYDRDCNLEQALEDLYVPCYYIPDTGIQFAPTQTEPEKDYFLLKLDFEESLTSTLQLLSLPELKAITAKFNISRTRKTSDTNGTTKSSSKSRADLIKDLLKVSSQGSLSTFFTHGSAKGKEVTEKSPKTESDSKKGILAEAKSFLGENVIRINPFVHKTITRAFTIYFRAREFETNYVECALLNEMAINNFPSYPITREQRFFNSRAELLEFEEAVNLSFDTEALLAGRTSGNRRQKAMDLFNSLEERFTFSLQAAAFSEVDNHPSVYNRLRLTPEWVGIKAALNLCNGGHTGEPAREWKFLDMFLSQHIYHNTQRGKAYIRKAILEMNQLSTNIELAQEVSSASDLERFADSLITAYQQFNPTSTLPKRQTAKKKVKPKEDTSENDIVITSTDKLTSGIKLFWSRKALQTCIQGLQDSSVHEVFHVDLKKRIMRLEKQLKVPMRSRHDFTHTVLKMCHHRTIQCDRIPEATPELNITYPKQVGYFQKDKAAPITTTVITKSDNPFKRPMFVDIEGERQSVNVEEASLSFYRTLGWEGTHSENSMLTTLFALLFWDIMFSPVTSCETGEPLPGIFEHHCQTFPFDIFSKSFYLNRKEAIDKRLDEIKSGYEFIKRQVTEVYDRESPRQTMCIGLAWYDLDALLAVLEGIGPAAMTTICEHLVKNYRVLKSGMPDLCLWKLDTRECMFSEVKSENDVLSDKQCYWIDILVNAGVSVEVCHVLEPKSYFKKMKLGPELGERHVNINN